MFICGEFLLELCLFYFISYIGHGGTCYTSPARDKCFVVEMI